METLEELQRREAELENAMKQPGGARVTEEQELQVVKRKLAALTDGSVTGRYSVQALRYSLTGAIEARRHRAPVKE